MPPPRRIIAIDAINGNDKVRGPDRYLIGLLHGLAELDHDSNYVVLHAPWQTFISTLTLPGNFRVVRCRPPRNRIARVLWHAITFPFIVARERPDVIHLPNIILSPCRSAPVVMTVHDLAHFRFPEKFGYFRGFTQRLLIHGALRFADRLIAVSEYTRADLARFARVDERRVAVIGEGGPEPVDIKTPPPERPYFLYVGQLERSKNVEALIKAFAASAQLREAGVVLKIAGTPSNAAERIIHLAAILAPDRVELLGYVGDAELPSLFAHAIAFVFPSLVEGFGLVLLEAMAYGAPIVASNASVIPEVLGEAGVLVDATDIDALQQALERVHRDPELRALLRQRGRERLTRFSWRETAHRTLEEYRRLAP